MRIMHVWEKHFAMAALAACLAVLAAGGCGAAQTAEPLDEAVRAYNDAIRWERFEMAAGRVPPEQRDDFLDQRDRLHGDLRIHHSEVVRVRFDAQQRRARVQVKYVWYLDSRGTVHETHAVQRWERRGRFWILTGEIRLRGEPMPGVSEPEPDAAGSSEGPVEDPSDDGTGDEPETRDETGTGVETGTGARDETGTGDDSEVPLPDPPVDPES